VPIQAATGNRDSCGSDSRRAVEGSKSRSARAAHGGAADALCFSHYSMLSVMEFGDFFFVWLNKGRTERTCDREIGGRVVNADFWPSGATHLYTWKKIKKIKKLKKSIFFEIKDDQVLYLCIILPLRNYFHCNLGKKKQNYDEYKVNSTWSCDVLSFFFYP
jgi:hypothetical protein